MARCIFFVITCAAASQLQQIHEPTLVPPLWQETNETAADDLQVPVFVALKRPNFGVIEKAFHETSDPQNPRYAEHLTHDQVRSAVAAPASAVAVVKSWLAAAGAGSVSLHHHGDSIKAVVPARGAEKLIGSPLRVYRAEPGAGGVVDGASGKEMTVVATGGVRVPTEVAAVVDGVGGFTHFPLPQRHRPAVGKKKKGDDDDDDDDTPAKYVTPGLIRTQYGITNVTSSGKKNIQAIAQFQGCFYQDKDVAKLCSKYGLGKCKVDKLVGDNSGGGDPTESSLDVEYTMSGVAGTDIETWVYGYKGMKIRDFCSDFTTLLSDVVSSDEHPWVVSVSYGSQHRGECGSTWIKRAEQDGQKLGAMGVTLLISSGDDGSGQNTRQGSNKGWLAPSWPSSMTSALAVGSTYFIDTAALSGEEEATTRFGSGGGFSTDYEMPDWQKDAIDAYLGSTTLPDGVKFCVPGHGGTLVDRCTTTGRGNPDVAFLGDNFDVVAMGIDISVGGTSASSPGFAAVISLLNEERLAKSGKTLGFVNPLFYQNPQIFTDITKGTNAEIDPSGHGGDVGWNCEKGWDAATGLGTPNFPAMLKLVKSL